MNNLVNCMKTFNSFNVIKNIKFNKSYINCSVIRHYCAFGRNETTFYSLNRLKYQNFVPKSHLSITCQRSQRLNQICRNAFKDKNPSKSKAEDASQWDQLRAMSLTQKLKFMFKKYWYISIPVHMITCLMWFGGSYLIAKSGFDVKPILDWIKPYAKKLPLPEFVKKMLDSDTNAGSAGYLAIALIIYKLLTPARYATTVGVSYYVIQFSVRRGMIKPAPSGQQIKAQVIKSRSQLNKVLRERLAKRDEMRKKSKNKKHK